MSKFNTLEIAISHPSNRGVMLDSKKALSMPFQPQYKYAEMWRSMFLYKSDTPNEEEALFGNFYLECDSLDFTTNRDTMLEAAKYLKDEYEISYLDISFYSTNKSIWLEVPAKVFECYGSKSLHLIYKSMAEEVHNAIKKENSDYELDLSIYKWNGLMHSLGSYLPKTKTWVNSFSYFDLEDALTMTDLKNAKYDSFVSYDNVESTIKAVNWFKNKRIETLYGGFSKDNNNTPVYQKPNKRACIDNLIANRGTSLNRNIHIYAYALHLKQLGYGVDDAILEIQKNYDNAYVDSQEAVRTIKSAILGDKHFNCETASSLLDDQFLDCANCIFGNKVKSENIIIPRLFIQDLQKLKVHYDTYKYLLLTLERKQTYSKPLVVNLKGVKYKKLLIERLEKLQVANIANITINKDSLIIDLINKDKDVYKSHLVFPKKILKTKFFKDIKNEIKVLLEIGRVSILKKQGKTAFYNRNIKSMAQDLSMTVKSVKSALLFLRKNKIIFANRLLLFLNNKEKKGLIKQLVQKIKLKVKKIKDLHYNSSKDVYSLHLHDKTTIESVIVALFLDAHITSKKNVPIAS